MGQSPQVARQNYNKFAQSAPVFTNKDIERYGSGRYETAQEAFQRANPNYVGRGSNEVGVDPFSAEGRRLMRPQIGSQQAIPQMRRAIAGGQPSVRQNQTGTTGTREPWFKTTVGNTVSDYDARGPLGVLMSTDIAGVAPNMFDDPRQASIGGKSISGPNLGYTQQSMPLMQRALNPVQKSRPATPIGNGPGYEVFNPFAGFFDRGQRRQPLKTSKEGFGGGMFSESLY